MLAPRLVRSAALLALSAAAHAEAVPANDSLSPAMRVVEDEPEPPPIAPARDKLGGHFVLGASGAVSLPFGALERGSGAGKLGPGLGGTLDLGFGLSRNVAVGAYGQLLTYGGSSDCPRCAATSFAVGPFVRYHLVQGLRFDPWVLAGAGYRRVEFDPDGTGGTANAAAASYSAFEFIHLVLGGDFYLFQNLALGPWLSLDAGVSGRGNELNAAYGNFSAGLRLVLDLPGK